MNSNESEDETRNTARYCQPPPVTRSESTGVASLPVGTGLSPAKVFVVVPVFERPLHTLACIEQLKSQTYPNLEILIVDGGSRDGSVTTLHRTYGITLIADIGEQWWTGCVWHGIKYAMEHGGSCDFVLLLNDDTTMPSTLIEVLVAEASSHHGAVEALQVDERDHETVVYAGARLRLGPVPLD